MDTNSTSIVMEYATRGTVFELVINDKMVIEPEHVRMMALDICRGMTYLHASQVIHRDLKTKNLLVDRSWSIKGTILS